MGRSRGLDDFISALLSLVTMKFFPNILEARVNDDFLVKWGLTNSHCEPDRLFQMRQFDINVAIKNHKNLNPSEISAAYDHLLFQVLRAREFVYPQFNCYELMQKFPSLDKNNAIRLNVFHGIVFSTDRLGIALRPWMRGRTFPILSLFLFLFLFFLSSPRHFPRDTR